MTVFELQKNKTYLLFREDTNFKTIARFTSLIRFSNKDIPNFENIVMLNLPPFKATGKDWAGNKLNMQYKILYFNKYSITEIDLNQHPEYLL